MYSVCRMNCLISKLYTVLDCTHGMKNEFEKYSKAVIDSADRITEASGNKDIVEAYENFDAMVRNACFACHKVSRSKWPKK